MARFACSANQHSKSTIEKKKPTYLCAPRELKQTCCIGKLVILIIEINNLLQVLTTGSAFRVHVISTYYVRKGSWGFLSKLPTNQRDRKIRSHGVNTTPTLTSRSPKQRASLARITCQRHVPYLVTRPSRNFLTLLICWEILWSTFPVPLKLILAL